jgi:hypothetical protein
MFKTTSTIKLNNFNSPSVLRPTALHRHQKAFKNHSGKSSSNHRKYSNVFEHRAKTAISHHKQRDKKMIHQAMKSVYVHDIGHRPMTEQPGSRNFKANMDQRREFSQKHSDSRPVSQGAAFSKAGTHTSTQHKNYVSKYKSSLRNLIKAASTRNDF